MKKRPLFFVELLFWKTRNESHYINAEVLMGGLVKMKKDIRNLDREGINLSNDKERPTRKSLADSLGDDDVDLVVPHDFNYQWQDSNKEAEDLSDGHDQKGLRKTKASAVKRRSAAISMNNENDEDKSEGATSDSQALNVSKRQKRHVFDEEQEFAIKDLYARIVLEQMVFNKCLVELHRNHHHFKGNPPIQTRFSENLQIVDQLRCQALMDCVGANGASDKSPSSRGQSSNTCTLQRKFANPKSTKMSSVDSTSEQKYEVLDWRRNIIAIGRVYNDSNQTTSHGIPFNKEEKVVLMMLGSEDL